MEYNFIFLFFSLGELFWHGFSLRRRFTYFDVDVDVVVAVVVVIVIVVARPQKQNFILSKYSHLFVFKEAERQNV